MLDIEQNNDGGRRRNERSSDGDTSGLEEEIIGENHVNNIVHELDEERSGISRIGRKTCIGHDREQSGPGKSVATRNSDYPGDSTPSSSTWEYNSVHGPS